VRTFARAATTFRLFVYRVPTRIALNDHDSTHVIPILTEAYGHGILSLSQLAARKERKPWASSGSFP